MLKRNYTSVAKRFIQSLESIKVKEHAAPWSYECAGFTGGRLA